MNISVKTEYALHAIFDLAVQPQGEPVKIADIARRQKIPQKFLELILSSLKQGGFVESRRGAEGGYRLARPADQITVGQVLKYVEQSKKTRRSPDAFVRDSLMPEPLPLLLVRLYQSPSRRPGQYTLPMPRLRSSLLTPRM